MKATLFNGKGDVDTWNTGVASAVAQGADAIMLNGMEPALVSGPLAEAERAGIATVYSEHLSDEDRKLGVDASVPQNYYDEGAALADYVMADSKCNAKVIMVTAGEYKSLRTLKEGYDAELANCKQCETVEVINMKVTDIANKLSSAVSVAVQRHPDVKYIVLGYDEAVTFIDSGLREVGRDDVQIIGRNGNIENLKQIVAGETFQTVDLTTPPPEAVGWASIDQLGRLLAGVEPSKAVLPLQLFTKDNLPDDPTDTAALFPKYVGFEQEYLKLWGVD